MNYGPIVAERWKKQYFKRKQWKTYEDWQQQPEEIFIVLLELKSKKAIDALIGNSWTRKLPRQVCTTKENGI